MTLQNLLAIRRLQEHVADHAAVQRLLSAARRNLDDARVDRISADNRFDAAYKCIMQCAMLGLWVSGYRTATSQPGHHQTAIQCLGLTLGVPNEDMSFSTPCGGSAISPTTKAIRSPMRR
jgi:hypothetical protein